MSCKSTKQMAKENIWHWQSSCTKFWKNWPFCLLGIYWIIYDPTGYLSLHWQDDEYATERLYNNKHVRLDSTDIFEQLRQRLNQVDTNLEDLKKTSALHNESATSHIPDPTDTGDIARSTRVCPPPEIKKRGLKQSIRSGNSSRPTTGSRAITYSESEGSSQPSFSLRFWHSALNP